MIPDSVIRTIIHDHSPYSVFIQSDFQVTEHLGHLEIELPMSETYSWKYVIELNSNSDYYTVYSVGSTSHSTPRFGYYKDDLSRFKIKKTKSKRSQRRKTRR